MAAYDRDSEYHRMLRRWLWDNGIDPVTVDESTAIRISDSECDDGTKWITYMEHVTTHNTDHYISRTVPLKAEFPINVITEARRENQ